MTNVEGDINSHYGRSGITVRVLAALADAGVDVSRLTVEDLAPADQFHTGGLAATRELAERARIGPGARVLDAGCGIGGPARYIATRHGGTVIGLDLSREFIAAANELNALLGISDRVRCSVGDITATGLPDGSFDVVWSQNVLMNVPDKRAAIDEAFRLLRPGGRFAVQCVMAGPGTGFEFPVMWASGPELNHLCTSAEFQGLASDSGFDMEWWSEDEGGQLRAKRNAAQASATDLNYGLIMNFPDFSEARAVTSRNMAERRAVPVSVVLVRA